MLTHSQANRQIIKNRQEVYNELDWQVTITTANKTTLFTS